MSPLLDLLVGLVEFSRKSILCSIAGKTTLKRDTLGMDDIDDLIEVMFVGVISVLLAHYYRSFFRLDQYSEPGVGHAYILWETYMFHSS